MRANKIKKASFTRENETFARYCLVLLFFTTTLSKKTMNKAADKKSANHFFFSPLGKCKKASLTVTVLSETRPSST